jgi:hypothetical protein
MQQRMIDCARNLLTAVSGHWDLLKRSSGGSAACGVSSKADAYCVELRAAFEPQREIQKQA